jgi:hypothetical protein
MSSNTPVLSQCTLPDTHFDAEPSSHCLFSHGFTIFDEDASQLSKLDSEKVPVPTEYQQTNANSYITVAEPEHLLDTLFDYTWLVWECYGVRDYTKPVHSVRRTAWWWRFGVPLAGKYIKKGSMQAIDGIHFLCRTCHATAPTLTRSLNVTNGSQHTLEHFWNVHTKLYKENLNGPLKELNKYNAINSSFNLHDPVHQRLYNSIAESFDSGLIKKDIMRWVTLENIPFKKLQNPHFGRYSAIYTCQCRTPLSHLRRQPASGCTLSSLCTKRRCKRY